MKSKTHRVTINLTDPAVAALLEREAEKRGVAVALLCRQFVEIGLGETDPKHAEVINRLDELRDQMKDNSLLLAAAVASSAFLLDDGKSPAQVVLEKAKSHIKRSSESAAGVLRIHQQAQAVLRK